MLRRFLDKRVDEDWLNTNFPCMMACPAHTNAGRYVGLIAEGRFEEAYRFARDPNPHGQYLWAVYAPIRARPPAAAAPSTSRSPSAH